jgi:hypothetical protein
MRRGTGATPVSAVGYTGYTGSGAPQAEARDTSLPAERRGGRSTGFLWGVGFAVLLGGAAFVGMQYQAAHVPVPVAHDDAPIARPIDAPAAPSARPSEEPAARPAATIAQPALPAPEPAPAAPAPAVEQQAARSPRGALPSARYAPQRSAQRGRSVAHESSEAAAPEVVARNEPAPQPEIEARKPEPVAPPEPKAVEPVAPAPAPVAQPAVAPPKPAAPKPDTRPLGANATFASVQAQGSLGASVVSRMLGRSTSLMQACYQTAAKAAGRNDFAPVAISLTIDEAGLVHSPKAGAHGLPGLSACITEGLKRVRSDQKPDVGVVKVEAQVSFRPL